MGNEQALSRSRGGLTTKVHLACDGRGLPLAVVVTPGNVNDSTVFGTVMETLRVCPEQAPDDHDADLTRPSRIRRIHPAPSARQALRERGIRVVIPERIDQKANHVRRGQAGGKPPIFDRELYKDRNVVERCFARLKQLRAIATLFDKLANRYEAGLQLASLILWLREPAQGPLSDSP
ncbi:IS5 family transposase [Streptomyces asoensis]|uniref:IS5 family transposase n=1 Tax=Streptomyces asoensis TaxID=249586 RepID=UPI0033C3F72D